MSKFNVGDSVRIRVDLTPGVVMDHIYCNNDMASWGGKLDTIKSVAKNGIGEVYYSLDHHSCYWNDAMLEPAELPKKRLEKLTIISNGTTTWATHRLPDGSVKKSRVLREQGMEQDFERDAKRAAREAGVKIGETRRQALRNDNRNRECDCFVRAPIYELSADEMQTIQERISICEKLGLDKAVANVLVELFTGIAMMQKSADQRTQKEGEDHG